MTCIVGLVHEGKVFIGGDSAGVAGWDLSVRSDQKVFANDDFVMGFTSSFRMGQLLRYSFTPPKRFPDVDIMKYMVTDFVDGVRNCLKNGGFAKSESGTESGGTFLVGYEGRLFCIESDYQVSEPESGYYSVGCGDSYAKGALFASKGMDPMKRVEQALNAAETHSAGVRGPFHYQSR